MSNPLRRIEKFRNNFSVYFCKKYEDDLLFDDSFQGMISHSVNMVTTALIYKL